MQGVLNSITTIQRTCPMTCGRLLLDADAAVIDLLRRLLPTPSVPEGYWSVVGLLDRDRLAGGAVFYSLQPYVDIMMGLAVDTPRALSRGACRDLAGYAFKMFGVARVTVEIARGNTRARRAAERAGFKLEGVRRRAYDGTEDAMVYGLLQEDLTL